LPAGAPGIGYAYIPRPPQFKALRILLLVPLAIVEKIFTFCHRLGEISLKVFSSGNLEPQREPSGNPPFLFSVAFLELLMFPKNVLAICPIDMLSSSPSRSLQSIKTLLGARLGPTLISP
jgi:hypothetical protein